MFTVVHDLDRLTCSVSGSTRSAGARLNAYRIDDTFHLDIDLPGVDPADIDIAVDRDVLTVRARRRPAEGDDRRPGPVHRQVALSDRLDTDRLDARYDNGVLTLSIPVKAGHAGDLGIAA
jgi:HSP20 family protein